MLASCIPLWSKACATRNEFVDEFVDDFAFNVTMREFVDEFSELDVSTFDQGMRRILMLQYEFRRRIRYVWPRLKAGGRAWYTSELRFRFKSKRRRCCLSRPARSRAPSTPSICTPVWCFITPSRCPSSVYWR